MNRYFNATDKGDGRGGWRKRLAPAVLLLGLGAAFKLTYDVSPREQRVQLLFDEALRSRLSALRVTYLEGDVAISGTEQRFEGDAPATITSTPDLAPGAYRVHVELSERDGRVRVSDHSLSVPSAGTMRIRLGATP